MHNVVTLISPDKKSQGRMKRVSDELFDRLKMHKLKRPSVRLELTSQDPLSRRALEKQQYNNLRASMDRHTRTEWMHKYGVDPYLPRNSTMPDGVRVIGGKGERGRLKDGTLSDAADW